MNVFEEKLHRLQENPLVARVVGALQPRVMEELPTIDKLEVSMSAGFIPGLEIIGKIGYELLRAFYWVIIYLVIPFAKKIGEGLVKIYSYGISWVATVGFVLPLILEIGFLANEIEENGYLLQNLNIEKLFPLLETYFVINSFSAILFVLIFLLIKNKF